MAVTCTEIRYKNFGRCLRMENPFAELVITLESGPRILKYAVSGGASFFHEDKSDSVREDGDMLTGLYGKGAVWHLYGGARVCPMFGAEGAFGRVRLPESYFPDNNRVRVEQSGRKFTFTPPPQRRCSWQVGLSVELEEYGPGVTVTAQLTNLLPQPRLASVGIPAALPTGSLLMTPISREREGELPDRLLAIWPGTALDDRRLYWGERLLMVRADRRIGHPLRLAVDNPSGWIAAAGREALMLRRFAAGETCVFSRGGCLEVSASSPVQTLQPGETVTHRELWNAVEEEKLPKPGDFETAALLERQYVDDAALPETL